MKRFFICLIAVALLLCTLCGVCRGLTYDVSFEVASKGAYVVNLDTGAAVWGKNEHVAYPTASTVKLLTAVVALDLCDDPENTVVTVSANLWGYLSQWNNYSLSGVKTGEQITLKNLLCCMLIPSGCEAASAIAAHFGYSDFIALMNEKLVELGCADSHVSNPHGLPADDQYASAYDMALIAQAALKYPLLVEICGSSRYTLPATNKNNARTLASSNLMLDKTKRYYWSEITGMKTGYTTQGGRNLVVTAERNGVHYLAVFMSAPRWSDGEWEDGYATFNDTYTCISWCFSNLSLTNDVSTGTSIYQIEVRASAEKDTLLLYPETDFVMLSQKGVERTITYNFDLPEKIYAPIAVGDVVGTAEIVVDGEVMGTVNLISRETVERNAFVAAIDWISEILATKTAKLVMGLLIVALAFYIVVIRAYIARSRRARSKKK